jgi:pilus assembly protein CpaF
MRPDRIVVGEVRGAEAFELTRAINAGCGFLCTLHANSARDAVNALVNAALMAGENVTDHVVRRVFSRSIDVVVQVERDAFGGATSGRAVREIVAVAPSLADGFTCEPLFTRSGPGRPLVWTGALPPALEDRVDRLLPGGQRLRDRLEHPGLPLVPKVRA